MTAQQITLVVPLTPNFPGMSIGTYDDSLAELEQGLITQFGGWTAVDGRGAWDEGLGDTFYEAVRVYTLATHIGLSYEGLATLRERVKVLLDQRVVYLAAYALAEQPVQ